MGSAAPIRRYTVEEYYSLEEGAEYRSEYYDGEIFAMVGGSARHSQICARIIHLLVARMKSPGCVPFSSDLRLKVMATGLRTYPDVSVYCGAREPGPADPSGQTMTNPALIVEVLSRSTEQYDRGTKAVHYRRIETLKTLLFVSQDQPRVDLHIRQTDGSWSLREIEGMNANVSLPDFGVELAMAEIYQGVDFNSDG